jgi:hypothetical protein
VNYNEQADAVSEALRVIYETTENELVLRVNLSMMTGADARFTIESVTNQALEDANSVINRAETLTGANLIQLRRNAEKGLKIIANKAYDKAVRLNNRIKRVNVDKLREVIFEQSQKGIEQGIKVTYKNKRQVGFKEYMEMNVRTTVQQQIGEMQLESGKAGKVVFYVVNHFADCADDHKDYQGKTYYDERWESFGLDEETTKRVKGIINQKHMISVQQARGDGIWLSTRPNCRHTFTPITIDRASNGNTEIVKDMGLSTGSYRTKQYQLTQEQRYNERQIRFFKTRREHNEALLKQDPSNPLLLEQVAKDKKTVTAWQSRQRALIKNNPELSRDYRRESQKILLQDLGVRYNT